MDARLSGFSNEEQVVTGDGGPVDWGARKGLSRAVRVDPRAEPDNQDVALWRRESRCKWKSSQFDEIEYMFPERICEDGFSPEDFTAQQIEAYVQDPLPNRPSTLVIYHGDGLISPDELDGDGRASGYAIAGEFFDTLNRHAKTLGPLLSDIYRPPPMGYLAQRYVPSGKKHLNVLEPSNGKLWELKVNPKGPSEDAETKKFNVFRERPERKGAFQYMGVYSFLLDRSPTGNSLTTDQIEYLQPYERPDIIPLGQWNSAEAAHRTFQEVYGRGHHNMLFYLPRIPYFTARRHSEDHRFLRRMMQIRKEVVEY